jgi:hypothetical protein
MHLVGHVASPDLLSKARAPPAAFRVLLQQLFCPATVISSLLKAIDIHAVQATALSLMNKFTERANH